MCKHIYCHVMYKPIFIFTGACGNMCSPLPSPAGSNETEVLTNWEPSWCEKQPGTATQSQLHDQNLWVNQGPPFAI